MSQISRLTTWAAGQVLTAAALNAEFNNIVNAWNNIDSASAAWTSLSVTNNLVVGGTATITGNSSITGSLFLGAGSIGSYKLRMNSTGLVGLSVYTTTSGSSANLHLENDSSNIWKIVNNCSATANPNKFMLIYNSTTCLTMDTGGATTWVGAMTVNAQLIAKGTATNDSASAGYIGEKITSGTIALANVASTGSYGNMGSISLTAGDWDIYATADLYANTATITGESSAAISVNTGNTTTDQVVGVNQVPWVRPASGTTENSVSLIYNLQLSGTTTVYLKAVSVYSGGNPQARGIIWARRVR